VGLLAVVQRGDRFLLVQRGRPPNQGRWGFPGGVQELGETMVDGALRELEEETGVAADDPRYLAALDAIDRDEAGAIRHHYSLVAIHLLWRAGDGVAADDAASLGWFRLDEIAALDPLPNVGKLIRDALAAARN
jgi:ADP-ribose pyrophosphatase YjhB (NUDIX family)